jgi:hypothetical protein
MVDVSGLQAAVARIPPGVDSLIAVLTGARDAINADLANDAAAQAVVNNVMNDLIASADKIDAAMATPPPTP